ncbi:Electron-transferring-flavoprotein dehydrogenase [mine drainage metagenome]|uniref:electron-transferring-flavoprotein dehydrogenase n=2 Tax=mine drainage metagenome TaxID=410659 RepID=T1BE81_9ZZZZ
MSDGDSLRYDVLVIGAGPAGLACAITLKRARPEWSVAVLEKAATLGAHSLSGAVIEPAFVDRLLPGWREDPIDIQVPVRRDEFVYLTPRKRWVLPTPPPMHNRGNLIISLGALVRRLGAVAEGLGVEIFPGFAAVEPILDGSGSLAGVLVGEAGRMRDGSMGPNFSPGVAVRAPVTVVAEGCRGSLAKELIRHFGLDRGKEPQTYGLGMKELWQLPKGRVQPGTVIHTVGWPLPRETYGGGFVYHLDRDRLAIGFVVGLDYHDPDFSPFEAFQAFKHHPSLKGLFAGGEILSAGARSLIEGGYGALPVLEMPGGVLVGDAGGTLNVPKIKGVHLALGSGILAAEHLAQTGSPVGFDRHFRRSALGRELFRVRNIRPGFRGGLFAGLANAALETLTRGHLPWTLHNAADWTTLRSRSDPGPRPVAAVARTLPPEDRLAFVDLAAIRHEENQPVHLHVADTGICITQCLPRFGNPCTRFCPAGVYEIVTDPRGPRLQINAANCVHCKACDIKDPYEIITWVPPEGGSGPGYANL